MIRHRRMDVAELGRVLDWAADEGWNPGLDDAAAFHAADPEGVFLALADDVPVAAISVVVHGSDRAFLGLYLCRPDWRGRGVGTALWAHAMEHAGDRTVGLDAVAAQRATYARLGFVAQGMTVRMSGMPAAVSWPTVPVRPARPEDVDALVALEGRASGWVKPRYLRAWVGGSDTRRSFVVDGADGRPTGFATVRRCRAGAKVGPLVAGDAATADALILRCAAEMPGALSVDARTSALVARCAALGLVPGFETTRMYRGPAPDAPSDAAFHAVTSLELG